MHNGKNSSIVTSCVTPEERFAKVKKDLLELYAKRQKELEDALANARQNKDKHTEELYARMLTEFKEQLEKYKFNIDDTTMMYIMYMANTCISNARINGKELKELRENGIKEISTTPLEKTEDEYQLCRWIRNRIQNEILDFFKKYDVSIPLNMSDLERIFIEFGCKGSFPQLYEVEAMLKPLGYSIADETGDYIKKEYAGYSNRGGEVLHAALRGIRHDLISLENRTRFALTPSSGKNNIYLSKELENMIENGYAQTPIEVIEHLLKTIRILSLYCWVTNINWKAPSGLEFDPGLLVTYEESMKNYKSLVQNLPSPSIKK